MQLIAIVSPIVSPNALGALLCAILLGSTFMGIVTMVLAETRIIAPNSSTMIMALVTGLYSAGQVIGPGYAGYVAEATGSFNIPLFTGGVFLFSAIVLLFRLEKSR